MRFLIVVALGSIGCGSKSETKPIEKKDAGAPQSSADLAAHYDKKCAAGDLEACRSLAIMYSEGVGVGKNLPKAAQMFDAACTAGNMAACNHFGRALADGEGIAKDPQRAVTAYQKACDGGHALGCRNLGLMLGDGRGVAADLPRAATVLDKACTLKAPFGCTNAGDVDAVLAATDKPSETAHWKAANEHYQKGCEQGEGSSCRQIALAYISGGRGLPKGTAAALVWLERGCKLDEVVACRLLGNALLATDVERGKQLLRKGCDRKDADSCRDLSAAAATPAGSGSGSTEH